MIEIPFLVGELCFTLIWIAVRVIVWIKRGGIDWKREAMLLLMYVNLAVIIRFTFFPMELKDGMIQPLPFDASKILPFNLRLVPFKRLFEYPSTKDMLIDVVGNFAMFIPTGVILPILYKKIDSFWKTVGVGALISLGIELLQLLFYTRYTSVNDLIFNALGAAAGYGIYALVRTMIKKDQRKSVNDES